MKPLNLKVKPARSWDAPQRCIAKVESTGTDLNIRYIVSNLPDKTARQIYFDVYVQRGEASENRIKEVKTICYCRPVVQSQLLSQLPAATGQLPCL